MGVVGSQADWTDPAPASLRQSLDWSVSCRAAGAGTQPENGVDRPTVQRTVQLSRRRPLFVRLGLSAFLFPLSFKLKTIIIPSWSLPFFLLVASPLAYPHQSRWHQPTGLALSRFVHVLRTDGEKTRVPFTLNPSTLAPATRLLPHAHATRLTCLKTVPLACRLINYIAAPFPS